MTLVFASYWLMAVLITQIQQTVPNSSLIPSLSPTLVYLTFVYIRKCGRESGDEVILIHEPVYMYYARVLHVYGSVLIVSVSIYSD